MDEAIHVARRWLEAMNAQDIKRMSSFCWEDAVGEEVASPPPAVGREQIAKSYRELFEGFPDCKAEILNIFSGRDQVLAEDQECNPLWMTRESLSQKSRKPLSKSTKSRRNIASPSTPSAISATGIFIPSSSPTPEIRSNGIPSER
jgi:hypothetical protein